jgi:hypothetical protein
VPKSQLGTVWILNVLNFDLHYVFLVFWFSNKNKLQPKDLHIFPLQDGHDDAELAEIELSSNSSSDGLKKEPGDEQSTSARSAATLNQLIARQYKFLESVRDFKTIQFLSAMAQLAHMDTGLAEHTWLRFFPQVTEITRNVGSSL